MSLNPFQTYANDKRSDLRVTDNKRINWQLRDSQASGMAWIRNISSSGMMVETDSSYVPLVGGALTFDTTVSAADYIPGLGNLVWHKRKPFSSDRYLWGIQFMDVSQETVARLRERVQEGILKLAKSRQTEIYAKAGLLALSVMLSIYLFVLVTNVHRVVLSSNASLLKTSQLQSELYHVSAIRITNLKTELATTKALYEQSQEMLQTVSSELGATKMVLSDTERMLSEARAEIASVKTQMVQYTRDIAALEDKNIQLTQELDALKVKIDYYEGNVKDMTQAREWVQMYKSRLKLVKSRVSYFKKQAQDVRKAAQKERDHVRTILGNNGYLVRDGKVVNVDVEKYNSAGTGDLKASGQTSGSKARVDVQVFR